MSLGWRRKLLFVGVRDNNHDYPIESRKYKEYDIKFWKDAFIFDDVLKEDSCYDHFCLRNLMILDIGAHVGGYSIKAIDEGARGVFAFEAEPTNFQFLLANIEGCNANIVSFNIAISDENKMKSIHYSAWPSGCNVVGEGGFMSIMAITIDSIENLPTIDLVKIDIEGLEAKAINGMRNLIKRDKPKMIIACEHGDDQPKEISELLESLGYKIFVKGDVVFGE